MPEAAKALDPGLDDAAIATWMKANGFQQQVTHGSTYKILTAGREAPEEFHRASQRMRMLLVPEFRALKAVLQKKSFVLRSAHTLLHRPVTCPRPTVVIRAWVGSCRGRGVRHLLYRSKKTSLTNPGPDVPLAPPAPPAVAIRFAVVPPKAREACRRP